jgi:undecaprenyl-diphosphatase
MKRAFNFFRRYDFVLLFSGLLVVLGLWGFFEIADEMQEIEAHHFDYWIMQVLRQPDNPERLRGPAWLAEAARDITGLGGYAVLSLITSVIAGFLLLQRNFLLFGFTVLIALGGHLMNMWLKIFYGRERPDVIHLVDVASASFPSGHAMLSAVIYLSLAVLLASVQSKVRYRIYTIAIAMLVTFLVGISRIFLGVHYPTDVLAGWTAGLAWASLCWFFIRYLQLKSGSNIDDNSIPD